MFLRKTLGGLAFASALAFSTVALAQVEVASMVELKAKVMAIQGSNTYVLVTITNTGPQILDQLNFKCVLTFQGEPVGVAQGYIQRLAPGKSDTVQVYSNSAVQSDSYTCRPTQALIYF